MSDLLPGVTRYRRTLRRAPEKMGRVPFLPGLLLAVLVAVPGLVTGTDVRFVLLAIVLGLVVPPAAIVVPWRALRYLVVLVYGIWLVAVMATASEDGYVAAVAFCSVLGGSLTLTHLEYGRWWRARLASAEGAPAAGLDPRGGRDVGVLAWWVDKDFEYEMVDPSVDVVLSVIRSLDGRDRSVVSVYRGEGRLDVGGDVRGLLLVQQSGIRAGWHQLGSGGEEAGARDVVGVGVLGSVVSFRRDLLCGREGAEQAMRVWIERGERDRSLPWWKHPKGGDEENARRPAGLKETD